MRRLRWERSRSEVLVTDPLLLGPVGLFVASTAYATAVAANEPTLSGEPFGLRFPGPLRTQLALGMGSAISAPWPMPAIATWAAVRGHPGSDWAARTVLLVGAGMLAGVLAEPVTWGRRSASRKARASIPLHLAAGAAMIAAATYRLRQSGEAKPRVDFVSGERASLK